MAFCCAIGNHARKFVKDECYAIGSVCESHQKRYMNPGDGKDFVNLGNNNNLGRIEYAADEEPNYGVGFGSGKTGVETANTVISSATATASDVPFDPFTLLAAETRRQIREAMSRYPDEPFDIRGALLPGFVGDEAWRATASRAKFVLERRLDAASGDTIVCSDPDTGDACPNWVSAILLTPPSDHWFSGLMRRLLLSQPYPILAEDLQQHGHTRRLHCFGP